MIKYMKNKKQGGKNMLNFKKVILTKIMLIDQKLLNLSKG